MKKWNSPEIEVLAINETANGLLNLGFESPFNLISRSNEKKQPTTPVVNPVAPTETVTTPTQPEVVNDLTDLNS